MKKYIFLFLIALFSISQIQAMEVHISNRTDLLRKNETVEVKWSVVKSRLALKANDQVVVFDQSGKETVSQIVFEGKKEPQKLIFQVSLSAKKSAIFTIKKGSPKITETKAYGRFVPERKDDYAWENDRVAFRIYGPALLKTDGPSNGIDVWCKRTDKMVINNRYKLELVDHKSYHTDWGDGLDFYKVGRTLGAGAMAPFINDSLWLASNFITHETLDNGPIRTSFCLTYASFNVNGKQISEKRTFSLDAGYQLNRIEEQFENVSNTMTVASGIVMRSLKDTVEFNAKKGYAIYFEPKKKEEGNLYLAMVSPKSFKEVKVAKGHLLALSDYQPNTKLIYYAGNGWSKWGFPTNKSWVTYVKEFAEKLQNPLMVTIK